MSLDIGAAFGEGLDRTAARNGLLLAAAFAVVAFLTAVLHQTLFIGLFEAFLETVQGTPPEEMGLSQEEYDRLIADFETQLETLRENSPLALPLSAGLTAAILLAIAFVAEIVSVVAVRVFATDRTGSFPDDVGEGLPLATLNAFVGGIVVWGLVLIPILLGVIIVSGGVQSGQILVVPLGLLLVIPGVFFGVVFYFLRQEVALHRKNFVQALADSYRFTKGHRIEVFLLAAIVVLVSQMYIVAGSLVGYVSPIAGEIVSSLFAGVLTAFGAAVVTRAYVQLEAEPAPDAGTGEEDPYDAALGPDDIPE